MANGELKAPTAGAAMPSWRAPQVLLTAALRSSSLLGHDLINRFRAERYELFLSGHFALWASAGVVLPLLEYALWYRTPYVLLFAAVGAPQCVALAVGLRLAALSLQRCTLQNPQDYVSVRGPGAAYLEPSGD